VKVLLVDLENPKLKGTNFDNFTKNPLPFYTGHSLHSHKSSHGIVDPAAKVQQLEQHQTDQVSYDEKEDNNVEEEGSDDEGPRDPKPTPIHEEEGKNWG